MGYDCVTMDGKSANARREIIKQFMHLNSLCSSVLSENFVSMTKSGSRVDEEYVACGVRNTNDVIALIGIGDSIGNEYCVKSMSESEYPTYFNASSRVLSKLTPTGNSYSNAWREKCRLQ